MKAKLAKVLRVTTIPPLFALYLVLLLWWQVPGFFASGTHLAVAIACLTVFPTLSYPTTWLTKKAFREYRKMQRWMAIFFTLAGYAVLTIYAFAANATAQEMTVYLTYAISVLCVWLTSLTKCHVSAHTCGVAGPIVIAAYYIHPQFLWAFFLLAGVVWSSLYLKRHKLLELVLGAFFPIVVFFLLVAGYGV